MYRCYGETTKQTVILFVLGLIWVEPNAEYIEYTNLRMSWTVLMRYRAVCKYKMIQSPSNVGFGMYSVSYTYEQPFSMVYGSHTGPSYDRTSGATPDDMRKPWPPQHFLNSPQCRIFPCLVCPSPAILDSVQRSQRALDTIDDTETYWRGP